MRPASPTDLSLMPPVDGGPYPKLGDAEAAAALAELLADADVIAAAPDEARAAAWARMLAALVPTAQVVLCPATDALPGDGAPPSPANVGQRVAAFRAVRRAAERGGRIALVTSGEALARAYPEPAAFDAEPPTVAVGEGCDLQGLYDRLVDLGYQTDERVDEPGEVALRGQVLDVFPADARLPLRVEVVDGAIAAIRFYDPVDQRSVEETERHELGRVVEPAIEGAGVSFLDHLPDAVVVVGPAADERRRRLLLLTADTARRASRRAAHDIVDDARWQAAIGARRIAELKRDGDVPPRFVERRAPLAGFADAAHKALAAGDRVALLGGERDLRFLKRRVEKRLETTIESASDWNAVRGAKRGSVHLLAVPADHGFRRAGVLAVAAADLLGSRAGRDDREGQTATQLFAGPELRTGDTVIHESHGIGRIDGLETLPGDDGEAIRLSYAKDTTRLVPAADADRLWRYGSEDEAVSLDTLDGKSWQARRKGIDAAIAETARGLMAMAAARAERTAPVLEPAIAAYERFAAGFPFTETPDQLDAIEAVRGDLASGRPMDRLVVGDVGFGKTEVALRAAAVAALAGRQVAIAAPTTVLARQHLDTFTRRFEGTDIVVAGLSRLTTAADKRRVKAGLADGTIQIVVGTGAVAAKGIAYHDLALVIIDEEQRFGAADKDRLHALSSGHMLTMSATPIPRTLQAAMVGLRQLSIIATPPARRQPIRTAVSPFDGDVLRAALLRERARGGQSFVVVPRIADMTDTAARIAKLVPELELIQAHGRMPAAEIDEAMVAFARGDGDVLLATNIIEAGLDVPRANTMAIVHADRFGLSQLHQLRGRVGRGHRRGQVLLFTDKDAAIAPRTLKRLRTLEAFDRLGAGFAISARDLDMRGAGDLLGEAQAGHMKLIGVELYQELLADALRAAGGEDVERWTPDLHLGIAGRLPENWIPEADQRITLYARLSRLRSDAALDAFEAELEDRFGALPDEAAQLLAVARIRERARAARVARIDAGPAAIAFTPRPRTTIPEGLRALETKGDRLLWRDPPADADERLAKIGDLLLDERAAEG